MKRPLVTVAIGYIIGIIWGLYCNYSIALMYVIIISCCLIFKIIFKSDKKFKIFSLKRYFRYIKIIINFKVIVLIIISSFISNLIAIKLNNKYENLYSNVSNNTQIIGTIVSNVEEKEYKDIYKIKVVSVDGNNNYKDTYLLLSVKSNIKVNIEYGDKVQITGEFQEPNAQRNYKGFDYKEYLKTQKIYGTIKASKIEVLEKDTANFIITYSNKIFLKVKQNIEEVFPERESQLFLGIMLGYTKQLDEDIVESFRDSSISHILAVSGMNISYITIGLTFVFSHMLGRRKSKIFIVIILLMYMCITGFSPSVVRATIMGIMVLGANIFYRKSDIWTSIAFSLLIILIYNPFLIKSISVLLSYGGTIGIIVFNKTISNILDKIKIKDRRHKYRYFHNKNLIKIANILKNIVSITISAQINILPLMILYFNTAGLSFVLTNILVSIIIGPIVILGFLAIIISFVSTTLLQIIELVLTPFLKALVLISDLGNMLPLNKIYIGTPSVLELIIYYICIFILNSLYIICSNNNLTPFNIRVRNIVSLIKYNIRKKRKKIISIFLIVLIIFSVIFKIPKDLKIYFVDVGQGDCTLIITPKQKSILIDGGGSLTSDYDVGESTLIPYLLDRKITKINYMIISHFDQDHVGGLLTVLNELKVEMVFLAKQAEDSSQFQEFQEIIKEKKINIQVLQAGDLVNIEKGIYFKILHPSENIINENAINNNALVCKFMYNNFSMLFTGDIEEIAEKEIVKNYKDTDILNADILKIAHHGSKSSSTEEFLELVSPKIALIGVGQNNLYGHPADQTIERLEKIGTKIYRTDEDGEISIEVDKKGRIKIKRKICASY